MNDNINEKIEQCKIGIETLQKNLAELQKQKEQNTSNFYFSNFVGIKRKNPHYYDYFLAVGNYNCLNDVLEADDESRTGALLFTPSFAGQCFNANEIRTIIAKLQKLIS